MLIIRTIWIIGLSTGGAGGKLPPRMPSSLLQVTEHHYFPGMKGLAVAPLIRGTSGHSLLRKSSGMAGMPCSSLEWIVRWVMSW